MRNDPVRVGRNEKVAFAPGASRVVVDVVNLLEDQDVRWLGYPLASLPANEIKRSSAGSRSRRRLASRVGLSRATRRVHIRRS